MARYIHGNLAVDEQRPGSVSKETTRVVYRKKSIPVQEKLLYLFTIVVCVIAAGTIIWRYSQIYAMDNRIQEIERQMKVLQAENTKLKLEINQLNSHQRFQEESIRLGFTTSNDGGQANSGSTVNNGEKLAKAANPAKSTNP